MAKTLILAQGLELERLMGAVNKHGANRVIIVRNTHDLTDKLKKTVQELINSFEKEVMSEREGFKPFPSVIEVDSRTYWTDFFSLPDALSMIHSIIQSENEKGNEVALDVSSGTKIMAIAMFLAGQFNHKPVSYCIASKYFIEEISPVVPARVQIATSSDKSYDIPNLPMSLNTVSFSLLDHLARSPKKSAPSITDLVSKVKKKSPKSVTRGELVTATRELDILEYYGYVKRSKRPGKRVTAVELTREGERIVPLKTLFEKASE